jgi:hypothetical protein
MSLVIYKTTMTDLDLVVQNNMDVMSLISARMAVEEQTRRVNNLIKEARKLAIDVEDFDFSYLTDDFYNKNKVFINLQNKSIEIKSEKEILNRQKEYLEKCEKTAGKKQWFINYQSISW